MVDKADEVIEKYKKAQFKKSWVVIEFHGGKEEKIPVTKEGVVRSYADYIAKLLSNFYKDDSRFFVKEKE